MIKKLNYSQTFQEPILVKKAIGFFPPFPPTESFLKIDTVMTIIIFIFLIIKVYRSALAYRELKLILACQSIYLCVGNI